MTVRLLVATRSQHKLGELRELLRLPWLELVSLDEAGIEGDAVEDALTFRGNAILKARFYCARAGMPTLADDSGLEVDALDGGPGVTTKRYAGEDATDEQNNAKLLDALDGLPPERRRARYRCVLAFLDPRSAPVGGRPWVMTRSGTLEGRIALEGRGAGGFGYDPIFEPLDALAAGRTVGEMTQDEKDRISHRGRAARSMARYLRKRYRGEERALIPEAIRTG